MTDICKLTLIECVVWSDKPLGFWEVINMALKTHLCVRSPAYWGESVESIARGLIVQAVYHGNLWEACRKKGVRYPWKQRNAWNDAVTRLLYVKLHGEMIKREDEKDSPRGRRPEVWRAAQRQLELALNCEKKRRLKLNWIGKKRKRLASNKTM